MKHDTKIKGSEKINDRVVYTVNVDGIDVMVDFNSEKPEELVQHVAECMLHKQRGLLAKPDDGFVTVTVHQDDLADVQDLIAKKKSQRGDE